jgi:dolichol-phosphate mannosyltransferase
MLVSPENTAEVVSAPPTYSLVVPVYNEEAVIGELVERLRKLMDQLDGTCEVVFVDDGSRDTSPAMLAAANQADQRFKVVLLSRNFGHQMAITAGLDHAAGEAIVIMDADLQDPPEVVLEFAKRWREGYEVVYGIRADRTSEGYFKRTCANLFYRLLRRLSDVDIPRNVGDFRLVDRRVLDVVRGMPERSRFLRGLFSWVGFRQIGVPYTRPERFAGEVKYSVRKLVNLAADGILNFSSVPLRLALNIGFLAVAMSILGVIAIVVVNVVGTFTVPGWTSIAIAVLLLGGIQLFTLGVIGEYVGRIYDEVKMRPLYLVRETRGTRGPVAELPRRHIAADEGVDGNPDAIIDVDADVTRWIVQ